MADDIMIQGMKKATELPEEERQEITRQGIELAERMLEADPTSELGILLQLFVDTYGENARWAALGWMILPHPALNWEAPVTLINREEFNQVKEAFKMSFQDTQTQRTP